MQHRFSDTNKNFGRFWRNLDKFYEVQGRARGVWVEAVIVPRQDGIVPPSRWNWELDLDNG